MYKYIPRNDHDDAVVTRRLKIGQYEPETTRFVDLGLRSGTLWAADDAPGSNGYSFLPAVHIFNEHVPQHWQWVELLEQCRWEHTGPHRFRVTGPNGKSITLGAMSYWSSTISRYRRHHKHTLYNALDAHYVWMNDPGGRPIDAERSMRGNSCGPKVRCVKSAASAAVQQQPQITLTLPRNIKIKFE